VQHDHGLAGDRDEDDDRGQGRDPRAAGCRDHRDRHEERPADDPDHPVLRRGIAQARGGDGTIVAPLFGPGEDPVAVRRAGRRRSELHHAVARGRMQILLDAAVEDVGLDPDVAGPDQEPNRDHGDDRDPGEQELRAGHQRIR
jgi:hypothetical protein